MAISKERVIVLKILQRVLEEKAFLSPLLLYYLKNLSNEKRKFIQKLVFSCVKNIIRIDYIIKNFYRKDFSKLEPFVRTSLRAAIAELIILRRKPYAVCDSWTEIVKRKNIGAGKLINAILRNILRKGVPEFKEEWIKYSIPKWLFKKLKREYGFEFALNFSKWFHSQPPYYFRIICEKVNEEKIREEVENAYLKKGYFLSRLSFPPYCYKSFHHPWEVNLREEIYYVQDFSSQTVMHSFCTENIRNVWDMTSAPGGKSLYLSFLLKNKVKIIATEIRKGRGKVLNENFKKFKVDGKVIITDATQFLPRKEFDFIIIDAPCSGLGTIRKKPEILLRMKPDKICEISKIQERLLENGIKSLKKKGILLYITCTITPEENEKLTEKIASRFGLTIIEPCVPEFLKKIKYFFCNGFEADSDFIFGCILRK